MTLDYAIALSLAEGLSRAGLTARLHHDPTLVELAEPHLGQARALRADAASRGIHVIAWNDPRFPARLTTLTDLPPVLWYRGELPAADAPAVAIVGSRQASSIALETAARLASDLAAAGIVVVSGLARGVDSAAHRGALQTGRTVAVLGSGLDRVYPSEHSGLAGQIAQNGLVLSEHPPGMPPLPHHFPLRNRLISGLSLAVVVIEASEKSGSLITAGCALEQGREVFAVPGNVLSGRNRGGHALIRDGARIVESWIDIVTELGWSVGANAPEESSTSNSKKTTSGDCLLDAMVPGSPYELDELSASSGLEARILLPRLSDLELRGLVRRAGGGRFIRPM